VVGESLIADVLVTIDGAEHWTFADPGKREPVLE
jgi:hypothetical protein